MDHRRLVRAQGRCTGIGRWIIADAGDTDEQVHIAHNLAEHAPSARLRLWDCWGATLKRERAESGPLLSMIPTDRPLARWAIPMRCGRTSGWILNSFTDSLTMRKSTLTARVHTNGMENYWSLFKRSKALMFSWAVPSIPVSWCWSVPLQWAELDDGGWFLLALGGAEGKRLTHKALIGDNEPPRYHEETRAW
jgi:hypothetical protein